MPGDDTIVGSFRPPSTRGEACLVVLHAPSKRLLGARLILGPRDATLGRDADCDLALEVSDVSRRHARVEAGEGGYELRDLGSTNGTWVGAERIERRRLAPGDLVRIGSVVLKYLEGDDLEALYHAEVVRLAHEDALTGLANRAAFNAALAREVARSRRSAHPLALAILDIDHFKAVNDRHGHLAGDQVLRELGAALRPLVRSEQLLARMGGEELALLLPDVTLDKAVLFAEKLRALVAGHPFPCPGQVLAVTVSIGVAALEPGDPSPDALVARADVKLYEAKRGGRDQVAS